MPSSDNNIPFYEVAVIGGGPAGAEAALASARRGARTLCLTISLDSIGYPPATPVLVEGADDPRGCMLEDMEMIGGALPDLVKGHGVARERAGAGSFRGRLVIDRRNLGLAYKERLESAEHLELRQALVTSVEPRAAKEDKSAWRLTGNLGERFEATNVVVAAGTFLGGVVDDAGDLVPGGRWGEIPANALASWLQNLGLRMTEVRAASGIRIASRQARSDQTPLVAASGGSGATPEANGRADVVRSDNDFTPDGSQLDELLIREFRPAGNRLKQLAAVRKETGESKAWVTRAAYSVRHLVLEAGQVDDNLESARHHGLFFAGRVAGSGSYVEAALLGAIAGSNAVAGGQAHDILINKTKYGVKLCAAIAGQKSRPVSIEGCASG